MGLTIFGNSNYTAGNWIAEPRDRGTWNLVQSCVITLGLCVYTSLHLNVFSADVSWWTRWRIRLKWVVIALLTPEFFVFNAWVQRRLAVKVAKALSNKYKQKNWWGRKMQAFGDWRAVKQPADGERPIEEINTLQSSGCPQQPTPPHMITPTPEQCSQGFPSGETSNLDLSLGLPEQKQVTRKCPVVCERPQLSGKMGSILTYMWHTYLDAKAWYYCKSPPKHEEEFFDIKHGFFVVMGGLVIDRTRIPGHDSNRCSDSGAERTSKRCSRLTITTPGLLHLLQLDGSDNTSDHPVARLLKHDMINGKSKKDWLAKTIVITQTLWFCAQFCARVHQKLPISLLELNTFAHAVCALILYPLWWEKPVDVEDPFVLKAVKWEPLQKICQPHTQHSLFILPRGFRRMTYEQDGDKLLVRSRIRNSSFREYRQLFYDIRLGRTTISEEIKEVLWLHVMLFLASGLYCAVHMLAWGCNAFRKTGPDVDLWTVSCLLLIPCLTFYILVVICSAIGHSRGIFERWVERITIKEGTEQYRTWRFKGRMKILEEMRRENKIFWESKVDVIDRRKSFERDRVKKRIIVVKIVDVVVIGVLALLGVAAFTLYTASRLYIQVAVFLAVPYADPGVYKVPKFLTILAAPLARHN